MMSFLRRRRPRPPPTPHCPPELHGARSCRRAATRARCPTTTCCPTMCRPDPCKSASAGQSHAGNRRRHHARENARRQARRLHASDLADHRLHVQPAARCARRRQAIPRDRGLRGRLRSIRLEARVHRPLRSAGLLRSGRQRDRRRDEGRRHRQGARHRAGHRLLLSERHLPHDGLGRAEPRPLHRAPHPAVG